jgi:hypothetical protein
MKRSSKQEAVPIMDGDITAGAAIIAAGAEGAALTTVGGIIAIVFMEQRAVGTMRIWSEPFTTLRVPKIFNLRTDPYERADITANTYYEWVNAEGWVNAQIIAV